MGKTDLFTQFYPTGFTQCQHWCQWAEPRSAGGLPEIHAEYSTFPAVSVGGHAPMPPWLRHCFHLLASSSFSSRDAPTIGK